MATGASSTHTIDARTAYEFGARAHTQLKVREGEKPLSEVSPAAPEQVEALSRSINARFAANADLYRRGWFRFFQLLDDDHSGRIAYPELSAGLRHELGMGRKELPEEELQALA